MMLQQASKAGPVVAGIVGGIVILAMLGGMAWVLMLYGQTKAELAVSHQQIQYMQKQMQVMSEAHKETLQELGMAEEDGKGITNVMMDLVIRNTERSIERQLRRDQAMEQAEAEVQVSDEPEPEPDTPGFWQTLWSE